MNKIRIFFDLPGSSDKALPKSTKMLNSTKQAPTNNFMVINVTQSLAIKKKYYSSLIV